MSLAVQKQAVFFSATRRAVAPRAAARAVRVMAQLSQDELKKQVGGAMGLPARRRRCRGGAERRSAAAAGWCLRSVLAPAVTVLLPHSCCDVCLLECICTAASTLFHAAPCHPSCPLAAPHPKPSPLAPAIGAPPLPQHACPDAPCLPLPPPVPYRRPGRRWSM